MTRGPTSPIPADRLERRFPDHKPLLPESEARFESRRCLYCHDAPCITACPTAIDIPTFIRKIGTGNLAGSARTILTANLLGASCARVCPVEVLCEGSCVYVAWGREAIPIGRLQRYAMERGALPELLTKAAPSGRSVGLVGSGPSSLACAGTLALLGHEAVIYEKEMLPGGLNTSGVAPYKLPVEGALREVEMIQALGVEIRTGVEIGEDIGTDELLRRHDAVFLGPGLGSDSPLGVPGEDGPGVVGGVEWIRRLKTAPAVDIASWRSAIVVGGGNTAVDVARELCGLGVPNVTLLYRRGEADMKAYRHELAAARAEGTVVLERVVVTEIIREEGRVTAVRTAPARDGKPIAGEVTELLPADLVVTAIGQARLARLVAGLPGVERDGRGDIVADPVTFATGNPRVFAGGDAVNGGMEVVNAVHDGQVAARSIDRMLRAASGPAGGTLPTGASHA